MPSTITIKRKKRFCREILSHTSTQIGFVDVGSGGELKFPWNLLPSDKLNKIDFDPEVLRVTDKMPICISNKIGESVFYIANDPRSSSLHPASNEFVERFSQRGLLVYEETVVMCTTLDQLFAGRFLEVDFLDVNVEGHDLQVLEGSNLLFTEGFIKCIKIEFELTQVWQGQGWFGDIDTELRRRGYDLAFIDVEFSRPTSASSIYHVGEPLWGKAIYVPGMEYWKRMFERMGTEAFKDGALKALALYTALDLPGRSLDLLKFISEKQIVSQSWKEQLEAQVFSVFRYAKLDALSSRIARRIPLLSRLLK